MTNGEMGVEITRDIIRSVAKMYGWSGMIGEPFEEGSVPHDQLKRYVGHDAFSPDEVAFITTEGDRLMVQQLPCPRLCRLEG